jgi:hypothetical protein
MQGSTKDMLQDRAGIIVLREDLDFYVIPPRPDIEAVEMTEIKRAAGKSLLKQNGIFSGLKRSEEAGTTEQHLIEMLTAGYVLFWGYGTHSANASSADSITTTCGAIALVNPTKQSCAVWPLLVYEQTSGRTLQALMLSAWLRNYCCSGESRQGDAGGKVWSSRVLKGFKAS